MTGLAAATERSLRRGVEFLLAVRSSGEASCASQRSSASWREFIAFGVNSDEWVTGYAGCALAHTGYTDALEAAARAWAWLAAQCREHDAGFGYNTTTPRDADSTLWGCRLAAELNRSADECSVQALRFVQKCAQADGGIASYTDDDLKPLNIGTGDALAGWTTSHDCVSAGAAWLPEICEWVDVRGYLARTQQENGSWRSYWWLDHEYATAFAVESLARDGGYPDAVERGATWLTEGYHRHSPFVLALRTLGIAAAGHHPFETCLQELLDLQRADGSWPVSARVRIPPPFLKDPQRIWNWNEQSDGIGCIIPDRFRVFTTRNRSAGARDVSDPVGQRLSAELAAADFAPSPLLVKLVGSRIADRGASELDRVGLSGLQDEDLRRICIHHLGVGACFTEFLISSLKLPRDFRAKAASLGGLAHTIYAAFDSLLDFSQTVPDVFGDYRPLISDSEVSDKQTLVVTLVQRYFRALNALSSEGDKVRTLLDDAIRKLYDAELESAIKVDIRRRTWWRKNALPIVVMGLPGWFSPLKGSNISFSEQLFWLGRVGEFLGWVDDFSDYERDCASGQPNRLRNSSEDSIERLARQVAAKGRRVLAAWDLRNALSAPRDVFTVIVWGWLANPSCEAPHNPPAGAPDAFGSSR